MTILIATTNAWKLREMLAFLGDLPVEFKTLTDFQTLPMAEESGASFAENARQKAAHYSILTGLPTAAEDSGLEIDALGGEPGVYSARFGGTASYPERFQEIYRRLRARTTETSSARFVCALAFATGQRVLFETVGIVEGALAPAPSGHEGFGYDPIFFYPPYGRTFGEVSAQQKAAVSHRGRATRAFRQFLQHYPRTSEPFEPAP